MSHPAPDAPSPALLTRTQEAALALTIAVVTANAYYIHPIIGDVARAFGVGEAEIGLVPALNQLALALGILLLLPLGDFYANRRLCLIFVAGQTLCLGGMVLAQDFVLFAAASTLLGFCTIAPYLIPAFASKRVAPERLGQVTAKLTAAVIFGILVARMGAGIIAEYADWHAVYVGAFALMAAVTAFLPIAMRSERAAPKQAQARYSALIASVFSLAAKHPDMRLSAAIQGLNFAIFTASWLALALHLTSPAMGYGTDDVGYLAGVAAISVFTTPRLGRWADRVGARKARLTVAAVQLAGIALFYPLGFSIGGLLVPLLIVNMVGPTIDVTGRMTLFTLAPEIRTRLTTSYIVAMFIGGAIGSAAGTAVYDWSGWGGTCALMFGLSLCVLGLSLHAERRWRRLQSVKTD
ncbi:MFS transporter [Porphyrobacter sp. TH134]|uniref:MFS transporter n=1 Tax=Porphyrobacter sp. TH134 TaxID=2067450 RepID=UPI000C7C8932|nr:MFS transporter [Porphyrobacter sp. TH134]PLK25070.1 MFS transporter [Porphyrobacter sp. TH134]